jgi:hypothetical protein
MAVEFPNNPTIGQIFSTPGSSIQYTWTGISWSSIPSTATLYTPKIYTLTDPNNPIIMDSFAVRVSDAGNRSLQIRTTVGTTKSIAGSTQYLLASTNGGTSFFAKSVSPTAWTYFEPGWSFATKGNTQIVWFFDETTFETYKVTWMVNSSYNSNATIIEKLWQ